MSRLTRLPETAAIATAMLIAAGGAWPVPALAAPQHGSTHSPAHSVRRHPVQAVALAGPVVYRPVIASYGYRSVTSHRLPQSQSAALPPVYYVPPLSGYPSPFYFDRAPAPDATGWNWQRVSLQQIDAEIRARRAAAVPKGPEQAETGR